MHLKTSKKTQTVTLVHLEYFGPVSDNLIVQPGNMDTQPSAGDAANRP